MFLAGVLFVLTLLTAIHWYVDARHKAVITKVSKTLLMSWSAISITLGLSAGSLSLSSFSETAIEVSVTSVLRFLSIYGAAVLILLLISLVVFFSIKKEAN